MSLQKVDENELDEENRNNKSSNFATGLGIVAAVGIGVGAALYYFVHKSQRPANEGSTSEQALTIRRNNSISEAFRNRANTLELCSICFEAILKDQPEMSFKCTHRFHAGCILPWLEGHQTCPNCRKDI
ncbi:uncharacterized protein LOC126973338 [Leptidea sinapis]|uniref:uncharacterized protein LOC126973338 n=1 Tax=Leptidea sinapis TaxID=189913 RepID=UPI00213A8ABE|nr:uncharacterized protein LOC126973338 [Leptidea sinapis]